MARPTRITPGAPCWVDLSTSDQDRAREFYSAVFGWTAGEADPQFGGYFLFLKDGLPVAGCMGRMPDQEGPDAWLVHLATDDVQRTLAAVREHGGQVHVDAMDVADLGRMSVLTDPSGAALGAWQPKSFHGFGIAYENQAPAWFELHTRKYEAAVAFYRDVFGWKTETASDNDQLRYTLLKPGDTQLAGIMDDTPHTPPSVPSHWTVYFGTADADATAATVAKLGGSVLMPPMDTPYGRLAGCTDPTGAQFNLLQETAAMPLATAGEPTSARVSQ